jgi:tetratricopeptide (TPR) repeat protein
VLKARVMARKGEHEAAISALDALVAGAPAKSATARDAKLAKAESLAALAKPEEAEAVILEVITEAPAEDDRFQAVAHNTLGDCRRAAGQYKDALIAFLKTDILYSDAKDEHARALAQISELWQLLKQEPRAVEASERLRELYPRSPYVKSQ